MKFTAPVIAAISAGSLVILTLIVGAILYARGFFDSGKEPEKPSDPNPKDELTKAVDEVASHLNPTVCAALKAGTIDLDHEKVFNWVKNSLKKNEDKEALEKIFDVSLLCLKNSLEEAEKLTTDKAAMKKHLDCTHSVLHICLRSHEAS